MADIVLPKKRRLIACSIDFLILIKDKKIIKSTYKKLKNQ